jgi:hypothetical protein
VLDRVCVARKLDEPNTGRRDESPYEPASISASSRAIGACDRPFASTVG